MQTRVEKTMLHEPFIFHVPVRGLMNLVGIKKVPMRIYPLYYGTMIKISGKMEKLQTTTKEDLERGKVFKTSFNMIGRNANLVSLMIAMAILNSRLKIKLFTRPLAMWLKWHLNSQTGNAIMGEVLKYTNIEDFLDTIISLRGLNVLGPKTEMSQNITGETIAPGGSSETV